MSKSELVGGVALHDLHVFDTFQQPLFTSIGDPYNDKKVLGDRDKGKQMQTNPIKKGRTDKVLLDKSYIPLAVGDAYDSQKKKEKEDLKKNKEKNITSKAFVPANPPKKSVGKGSLYGTLTPPPPHQPEGFRELKREDIKPSARNFQTNPPKRGGYGSGYHTTIGGKEFEYQPEPYGGDKTKKWPGQIKSKPIARAFNTTIYGDKPFDKNPYTEEGIKKRAVSAPKKAKEIKVPFRGMTPMRGTINKFPEYKEDPGREKKKEVGTTRGIWKPSGTNDLSTPQSPIATRTISTNVTFERSFRK